VSKPKLTEVTYAELIDLLLDADEPTRKLLLEQALAVGDLTKSEAEKLIELVAAWNEPPRRDKPR
jgi:hypothetical protein